MSRADGTPVVVMTHRVLGDVELALLGVLPDGHRLGGPAVPTGSTGPRAGIDLSPEPAAAALSAGRLLLVDEEQTPIAMLNELSEAPPGSAPGGAEGTRLLIGTLLRERHRESGSGRAHRLSTDDLARRWASLVVLARPLTDADALPEPSTGDPLLLVVPDEPASSDGVPTATMVAIAQAAAVRHGLTEVRTAPLRWRDPASDRALVGLLGSAAGVAEPLLLHSSPELDTRAGSWAAARRHLEGAIDRTPTPGIPPSDDALLRRWRPPRPDRGLAVMFTGLSGSGKSTLARALRDRVVEQGSRTVTLLDGDVVRHLLSAGLGFDRDSRVMNVRRIGYVAAEVARHGGMALCAPIAPYASVRADVRRMVSEVGDFVLVHVSTPLAECERRDLKGLYAAARAGRIPEFTGISDPYDVPGDADVVVDTSVTSIAEGTDRVFGFLADGGWIQGASHVD